MPRHKPTKHTTYYELLDAVRNAPGCPLCNIEAVCIRRYFESLLYESINDPGVREELIRSRGYCQRHAHYLRQHGNGFGIAILYQDQIELFLRSLDELQTSLAKITTKREHAWSQTKTCPACRVQNDCRERYGSTLIQWIDDKEMRDAMDAGRGLCVPHFLALLGMTTDARLRMYLIEMQRTRMSSLLQELEEFRRKHDYRFRDERFGNEADSWSRAIKMMVGEQEVF